MADDDSGTFDLTQLDEETRTKVEGLMAGEVSGLKANNSELKGQLRTTRENQQSLETQVQTMSDALGGLDIDSVRELIEARENGDTQKLLGEKKFDEAFDLKLKKERSRWEREAAKAEETLTGELNSAVTELASLRERVKVMSLDEKSRAIFTKLPNAETGAADDVADHIRKIFTLDEDGVPVALDESGEPRLIRGTQQPLTIEHYLAEVMPGVKSWFFIKPEGSGAKGSKGSASHNGFGTGITSKKGADAQTRSVFMTAARKANKNAREEWDKLPSD